MAGLLDYIEAPIHAIGGLFGGGNSSPAPPAPVSAPAPAPAMADASGPAVPPTGYVPPPVMPQRGLLGDVLDSTFLGGAIQRHAAVEQARQMALYQGQRMSQIYGALPDDQKQAFMLDPQGYTAAIEKGLEPQKVADTERLIRPNISGGNVNAQHLGVTPQGATYTQNQDGPTTNTGGPGSIITAPVTDNVTQYNPLPTPGLGPQGGPPTGAPMLGAAAPAGPGSPPVVPAALAPQLGQMPPPGPGGAQSGVPRGIRNNNPGNVKALPNGQMWQGQTGVDEMGHAIFANPTDGVHATLTNLQTYANKHGINTVAGIAQRWKGQGDASGYTQYLAKQVGVKPGDKIDLNDPAILGKVAQGIFQFENGPKAMQTRFAQPTAAAGPAPQPPKIGAQGGALTTLVPGKTMGPPQFMNGPDGKRLPGKYQVAPDGSLKPVDGTVIPQADLLARQKTVLEDTDYKQAKASMAAYEAMVKNADKMTGPSAYSMLDTFARAINPGAVARPTVIQTIEQNLGLPAQLVGKLESMAGKGNLPPQTRQQILDAVYPFVQAHYGHASALNNANSDWATRNGVDPRDVTAPLGDLPPKVRVQLPPKEHLEANTAYITPKGTYLYNGKGFVPYGK
jgi:hypothetical protein